MQVSVDLTPRAFEFACHSKACAPPPAGRGGSDKSGSGGAKNSQTHLSPDSQKQSPYNLNFTKRAGQPSRHGHTGPANRVDPLNRLQKQKGGASIPRVTLPKSLGFRHSAKNSSSTLKPTKGFVQHKNAGKEAQARADAANKKMAEVNANRAKYGGLKSGGNVSATGNSQTKVPQGPQHGNRGGPVVSAKLPLRNATTGRLNPRPARAAFKQGTDEIIGNKTDSKRTTLSGGKVATVATYKGRKIKHVSSKGGMTRDQWREGG